MTLIIKTEFRSDLQVLRGIAVISVVLFHAFENQFPLGFLGVDVFFVISGFVITPLILRIYENTNSKLSSTLFEFYKRRFYRLIPALAVSIAFATFLLFLLGPTFGHKGIAAQGIATLFFLGNFGAYKFSGDYFSPTLNPLVHTWSLSVEEQIYIFIPLFFSLIIFRKGASKKVFVLGYFLLTFISFAFFLFPIFSQSLYGFFGVQSINEFSFYSPIERLWQFTIGGLLFLLGTKFKPSVNNRRSKFSILFLISLLYIFSNLNQDIKFSSIIATLIALGTVATRSLESLPKIFSQPLNWFGDRSYSIYLFHFPLVYLIKNSPLKWQLFIPSTILIVFALFLTLILSALSFRFIERRFRLSSLESSNNVRSGIKVFSLIALSFCLSLAVSINSTYFLISDKSVPRADVILPYDWDPDCKILQRDFGAKNLPCTYYESGNSRKILLIGDSTAASISKPLVELSGKYMTNVYVFTYAGCPFILDVEEFKIDELNENISSKCLEHNLEILKMVNVEDFSSIIYMQSNSSRYLGTMSSKSIRKLNSGIIDSLSFLDSNSSDVVVVGFTPEYVPVQSILELLLGRKGKLSPFPLQDNLYWSKTSASKSLYYLDIYRDFCSSSTCTVKNLNSDLFNDPVHVSYAGGRIIANKLFAVLTTEGISFR